MPWHIVKKQPLICHAVVYEIDETIAMTRFTDTRYVPRHFWGVLENLRGSKIPPRTRSRWLTKAKVSRDDDGCYGLAELMHMTELIVYLGQGKTFSDFCRDKFQESQQQTGTINADFEVIYGNW